jgi:nitrite reductase/ring-hydroxylating ferredoxin subunit
VSFVRFARRGELPPGSRRSGPVGLRNVAVFNVQGRLYAIEDACAHMKAPLSGGRLHGTRLTCSMHGWVYDIASGRRIDRETGCIRTFPVTIDGDEILVDPDSPRMPSEPEEPREEPEDDLPPLI